LLCCPGEQRQPAAEAHGDSERELPRGRDEYQPRVRRASQTLSNVESLGIDGHRDDPGAGSQESAACADVPRVLEPHLVPGVEEDAAHEIECLLRSGGDEDLIRRAADASRARQVLRNRAAKRR
jgi:hypothetical protein